MSEVTTVFPNKQLYRSIVIRNAKGKQYQVLPNTAELNIFEDLFSNTLSGNLVIADDLGLFEIIGFQGREKLTVELYTTPEATEVSIHDFFIFSVTDRMRATATSERFVVNFVSYELILNENTRCYKAYKGINSKAVKEIYEELGSDKKLELEETVGEFKFVMPSWTPFDCINWNAGRSKSSSSKGSYYLFYETLKGGFFYKSVEDLITKEPKKEYYYRPAGQTPLQIDSNNIMQYEVIESGDSVNPSDEHYSVLLNHDIIRKKVTKQRFSFETDNNGKLNEGELIGTLEKDAFDIDLGERRELFGMKPALRCNTKLVHSDTKSYYFDTAQPKINAMRQFQGLKVRMLIAGNRDLRVGDLIKTDMYRTKHVDTKNKDDEEKVKDKLLSGKWLITAIRYMYKPTDFYLAVEVVKDTREK